MPVEVTLGGVAVPVIPQRHGYLEHRIGPTVQAAINGGEGIDASNFLKWIGDSAYEVLSVLIPTLPGLIPEHQFRGYATKAAFDAGDFDEEAANAVTGHPTLPEIAEAYSVAMRVNGIEKLVELGKAVAGPEGLRYLRATMLSGLAGSLSSPTSASPSGESDLTSSSTTPPTSTESADSQTSALSA